MTSRNSFYDLNNSLVSLYPFGLSDEYWVSSEETESEETVDYWGSASSEETEVEGMTFDEQPYVPQSNKRKIVDEWWKKGKFGREQLECEIQCNFISSKIPYATRSCVNGIQ